MIRMTSATGGIDMTKEEYRFALHRMGLRQVDVSWITGVTHRHGRKWANGDTPIPQSVSLLLTALEEGRITPRWLKKNIPVPPPYNSSERA